MMCITLARVSARAHHFILMPSLMSGWAVVPRCFFALSYTVCLSFTMLLSVLCPELLLPCGQRRGKHTLRLRQLRSLALWQNSLLPQVMSPSSLTTSTTSETTEMIFQEESGDKDTVPSYLCDEELDDETIGKALSWPLFIQERQESADRRQAYHSHEDSSLPAQSFFAHSRTERPVHELGYFAELVQRKTKSRNGKRNNQDSLWKTKRANSRWF